MVNGMVVSVSTDITRREEAEAKVRESELRFRSFFEESAEAILLLDGDAIINCNPAAQRMIRCSNGEQGSVMNFSGISPERQPDGRLSTKKLSSMAALALKRKSIKFEWMLMRHDGSMFPAEVSMSVIKLQEKPAFYVTVRDISAWKEAEAGLLINKRELESRVKERTRKLSMLNKSLLREIETRKSVERQLEMSQEELRQLSEHLHCAREEERKRIAREIHDELGQSLSALKIDVSVAAPGNHAPLQEQTEAMTARIDGLIGKVRGICFELRPPILDHFGLTAAV